MYATSSANMDDFTKVLDVGMEASIGIGGSQLNKSANISDGSIESHIFAPNDRLGSCFVLIRRGTKILEDLESFNAVVYVKGYSGCCQVCLRRSEVVQQACQSPGDRI